MASAGVRQGQPVGRKVVSWLSKVFQLNSAGVHWPRAVILLDVMLVPLVVFWAIGHEQYLLSAVFGVLFAALADPGGSYRSRASRVAVFGLAGAGLTALGFGIGGEGWGWLVLAAFAVTLAAGLAAALGVHQFVAALLLNIWFIVVLALASGFHQHARITSYTWAQTAAWAGGTALWIAVTFTAWLVRGRQDAPPLLAEIPGDTARHKLTRPVVMFAVIRALVMAGTTALAFGLSLSHGYWMPIAAIVAMRPNLGSAALVAVQRLAGALIGAAAAILLLLIPANEHGLRFLSITHGLEVVAIVLFMHAAAIRFWNYAVYCGAVAAGVLIFLDLPQPADYGAEGDRVLWTLCGVATGVLVMLLAGLLAKQRTAKTPPGRPADVPAQRKTTAGQDLPSPSGHGAEPGTSAGRS
jgi:uncharacterized membrane protein YccC